MFNWLFSRKPAAAPKETPKVRPSYFSTHAAESGGSLIQPADVVRALVKGLPRVEVDGAQDSAAGGTSAKPILQQSNISDTLAMWFASQSFIGHQFAAILAQQWLINKACTMPARDAIRQGFDVVAVDGDDIPPEATKIFRRFDRQYRLNWNLEQFVRMGRIFGVRVVLFKVESTDPEYYEKPFNPDGVTSGSYKGMVQIDPYWMAPMLDQNAAASPDTQHFYEPTYWQINGKRYHRTHLVIYRHGDLPDLLKPQYLYGGIPVPQLIMERVYAAERVANEAPQLAQTKRTTVWQTDMSAFMAKGASGVQALLDWVSYRDNYGVKLGDKEADQFGQFDTSLADLDAVIMTQYQIVAAAANVPATKLLGTTPKGFNSTGDYEEASYHEELESLQTHDLTPLIERHHLLVMRSAIVPKLGIEPIETTAQWRPLDSPTAKEQADTNLSKAQAGAALVSSGAISSEDERKRIALDPTSGYHGIGLDEVAEEPEREEELDDDGDDAGK